MYQIVEFDVATGEFAPLPEEGRLVALLKRDGSRPLAFDFGESFHQSEARRVETVDPEQAHNLLQERLRIALLSRLAPEEGGAADASRTVPGGVTVAVCTRNRPADLELCLDAILSANGCGAAHVLVVDNAPSDDRTRDAVSLRPSVHYVREPVPGLDVARNRALSLAEGAWIVFVDDDVRVDNWWLDGLASAIHEHPDVAAVTGLVLPAELNSPAQVRFERSGGFGRGFEQVRWDGRHGPGNALHPLGAGVFGAGCNMAFRVDTMRQLGGFDESLDTGSPLAGGGDLDAFFRVLDAGHVLVYEPRMAVFHRHRRSTQELRRQYYSWGIGFAAFLEVRWADPKNRPMIIRMICWWTRYALRQVRAAMNREDREGTIVAIAELAGGAAGITRPQWRSRRRMNIRRTTFGHREPQ